MLQIKEYIRPKTLAEAYALAQDKKTTILGGGIWLRMQNKRIITAVDLSDLHLDTIEDTPEGYRIGAYVTLSQLERHAGLAAYANGAIADSISHIVGVQFRNMATIGGSLYGRFGFSDVLTVFAVLGASALFCGRGIVPLTEFAEKGMERDILTHVLLPKNRPDFTAYQVQRNTATDFPVLNTAVCLRGTTLTCAVGARPAHAVTVHRDGFINTAENRRALAAELSTLIPFASNSRGSADYRRHLCTVLVRRALEQQEA